MQKLLLLHLPYNAIFGRVYLQRRTRTCSRTRTFSSVLLTISHEPLFRVSFGFTRCARMRDEHVVDSLVVQL